MGTNENERGVGKRKVQNTGQVLLHRTKHSL